MFRRTLLLLSLLVSWLAASLGVAEAQFTSPANLSIWAVRFNATLINSTATTLTEIQAAPAAGLSLYVTDITMSASVAATITADQQLILKYGTGTNCGTGTTVIISYFNAINSGPFGGLTTPIKLPAANALCFIDAVAGNKSVSVGGYIAP